MREERVMPDRNVGSNLSITPAKQRVRRKKALVTLSRQVGSQKGLFQYLGLMAVANDHAYTLESRHIPRGALRVASGNHSLDLRIRTPNPPQIGPRIPFSLCGHAAGVENDHRGRSRIGGLNKPGLPKSCGDRLPVCPARPAAEVFHVVFCHIDKSINGIDSGLRVKSIHTTGSAGKSIT